MTSAQARKDRAHSAKSADRCARCGKPMPRAGGYLITGTGICCPRCSSKLKAAN